jgi:LPS sulfotransferase NodH
VNCRFECGRQHLESPQARLRLQKGMKKQYFSKNPSLERLLERMNSALAAAERSVEQPANQQFPLILVVGSPRSGTTLFMQWLAATKAVVVPTNFLARLYEAPAVALMIQKALFDPAYGYRDEFDSLHEIARQMPPFASDLGKTSGPLNHNSFFYFWRRFAPGLGLAGMTPDQRRAFELSDFGQEIRRIVGEAGAPFALKGLLVQYDLQLVARQVPQLFVVHVTREPLANMASLLRARERISGNVNEWWCSRPPGWEAFADRSPEVQVAAQVQLCNAALARQLDRFTEVQHISISYEDLCRNPQETWSQLAHALGRYYPVLPAYQGPPSFSATTISALEKDERRRLTKAWEVALALIEQPNA